MAEEKEGTKINIEGVGKFTIDMPSEKFDAMSPEEQGKIVDSVARQHALDGVGLLPRGLRENLFKTLGGKEIAGTVRALGPFLKTLFDTGDVNTAISAAGPAFESGLEEASASAKQFQERNPVLGTGAQVVGGAVGAGQVGTGLTNVLTRGAGTGVAGAAARVGAGGTVGAVEGGVVGGLAADPGQRLQGAETGAKIGAVVGTGVGLGVEGVRAAIQSNPARRALNLLNTALRADDVTPGAELNRRLAAMGDGATIADVGGVKTRATAREAVTRGLRSNRVNTALDARQSGLGARLMRSARRSLGTGSNRELLETTDDVIRTRAARADELYTAAYQHPIQATEGLRALMRNRDMGRAWVKAANLVNGERDAARAAVRAGNGTAEDITISQLPDLLTRRPDGSTIVNPDALRTTQVWDYMKRALDDDITASMATRANEIVARPTARTRVLQRLKNAMLTEVDRQNSVFAQARREFSGHSEALDAMDTGRNFMRGDQNLTIQQIREMPDSQREFFVVGATDAIRDIVERGNITSDIGKRIFGSVDKQRRLAAAFPTRQAYRRFQVDVISEARKTRVRRIIPSEAGSQTQPRQAGVQGLGIGVDALTGSKLNAIRRLLSSDKKMSQATADEFITMALRPDRAQQTSQMLAGLEAAGRLESRTRVGIAQILTGGVIGAVPSAEAREKSGAFRRRARQGGLLR